MCNCVVDSLREVVRRTTSRECARSPPMLADAQPVRSHHRFVSTGGYALRVTALPASSRRRKAAALPAPGWQCRLNVGAIVEAPMIKSAWSDAARGTRRARRARCMADVQGGSRILHRAADRRRYLRFRRRWYAEGRKRRRRWSRSSDPEPRSRPMRAASFAVHTPGRAGAPHLADQRRWTAAHRLASGGLQAGAR
jgi:hypothetical protein